MAASSGTLSAEPAEGFSLILGGPLFQILRRTHLTGDALELLRKRMLVISAVAWAPLFVLSLVQGHAFTSSLAVPFAKDFELHVRFLIALPLLIAAEYVVHVRLLPLLGVFRERGIILKSSRPQFEEAVASALRLRNSVVAELVLAAVVYAVGIQILWRHFIALDTSTWYALPTPAGTRLTFAGVWYGYVSLPIFQFLLCRWYLRVFIWGRFLWQVSKLELSLIPTHPDRLGGLGFLGGTVYAFVPLAMAHGAMLAGTFANRIYYAGAKLIDFKAEIALATGLVVFLVFAPLVVFAPRLSAARRRGVREYGTLAERYVREFDSKWVHPSTPTNDALLGSGDVQSLADMGNALEVVRTMNTVPISKEAVARVVAATLVPLLPLALTMMPLEELVKKLIGLLF